MVCPIASRGRPSMICCYVTCGNAAAPGEAEQPDRGIFPDLLRQQPPRARHILQHHDPCTLRLASSSSRKRTQKRCRLEGRGRSPKAFACTVADSARADGWFSCLPFHLARYRSYHGKAFCVPPAALLPGGRDGRGRTGMVVGSLLKV